MSKEKGREPKLQYIPKVPDDFGEDGGHFYKYYDEIADELDDDMVTSLKARLDGILIFTGLFAGINTAFLALTLPDMSADPADDTNALLLQLVTGGNGTIQSADDLPSAAFTPSPGIFPVNVLFSLSLTLAIICAFLAVLGQQWLVYYRKRSGGGVEHQRWEQLRRYLGARHWRLEGVLDDILPALLQTALVLFCVAFIIYIRTLSTTMCYVIAIPMAIALAILLTMSVVGVVDKWCPFKSTLSHFFQLLDEIPKKYKPLTYVIAFLVLVPFVLPLYAVLLVIALIIGLWMGLRVYYDLFRGREPDLLRDSHGRILRISETIVRYMLTSLVPVGKATVFLQAAAVKRVLCTSEDFNTLIYTAINIQAMNVTEGARNLLVEDTVQQRMEELIKGSEKSLASTYSRAFSHLLLGGQSAELFVEREERHLYQMEDSFPRMPKYYEEPHPLKERVGFILDALNACTESPDVRPVNFEETVFYFELLKLILDEKSDNQELSEWLDRVLQKQEPSKVSTPLIISLVACTVRMLNVGFKSASASPELRQEGQGGRERSDRDRFLSVQGERVEIAKQLIGTVGWEIQIVPSDSWWSFRRSVLGLIEIALTKRHQSPRQPEKSDIWLLEQALSLSTTNRHERNWESVAKSAVALLRSSDNPEDPTPDSASAQDTHKDNRLRCANILCQCVQAMRDHLKPDEFIRAVSPALDELEKYWERFKDDFNQNPDLKDVAMLGKWLEIRDALDKPEESGWGYGRHQQFSEAYPSLKAGFDVIASALQENETVPNAERNPGELPRVADLDKKTEQKELRSAVTDRATPKSDEHVHNPLVAVGGSQRDRGAREPNAKQQDEGRRQPSV